MGVIGRRAMVAGMVAGVAGAAAAQVIVAPGNDVGRLYTPERGSAERAALMDAARPPIEGALGVPVIFVVQVLNTDGTWAYLQAVPHNPDGSPMDWRRTRLAADWEAGFMSDIAMVLMQRGRHGWHVIDWVMGPTDVFWYGWVTDYGLPERLFLR